MPELPRRKHVRMREFDYHAPGAYFFTVCLNNRIPLFGEVEDGIAHLNDMGKCIEAVWLSTSQRYPSIDTDSFILMPDHAHGIVILKSEDLELSPVSFITFMNWFKSMTTVEYGRGVKTLGWPPYDRHLWQPDYIERVLRNEIELERYREYIEGNPGRWSQRHE